MNRVYFTLFIWTIEISQNSRKRLIPVPNNYYNTKLLNSYNTKISYAKVKYTSLSLILYDLLMYDLMYLHRDIKICNFPIGFECVEKTSLSKMKTSTTVIIIYII